MSSISYLFLFFLFALVDCRDHDGCTLLLHESNKAVTLFSWSSYCGAWSNILVSPVPTNVKGPDFLPFADVTCVALAWLANWLSWSILNLAVFNGFLLQLMKRARAEAWIAPCCSSLYSVRVSYISFGLSYVSYKFSFAYSTFLSLPSPFLALY